MERTYLGVVGGHTLTPEEAFTGVNAIVYDEGNGPLMALFREGYSNDDRRVVEVYHVPVDENLARRLTQEQRTRIARKMFAGEQQAEFLEKVDSDDVMVCAEVLMILGVYTGINVLFGWGPTEDLWYEEALTQWAPVIKNATHAQLALDAE